MAKDPVVHGHITIPITSEVIEAIADAVVLKLSVRGFIPALEPDKGIGRGLQSPDTQFLRLSDILKVIPVSSATWWRGVRSGRYPASIKLGPRTTAWRAEDIRELVEKLGTA